MSKASKMRDCPALGRSISAADCGEQRQSVLACPAECVYNPFRPEHYAQLLDLEGRVDTKSMEQTNELILDPVAFDRDLAKASRGGVVTMQTFYIWTLFLGPGADGLTLAQRWERAGWTGLKNDERVLLRGKMQTRVALLEFHRILPDGRMEVVDLFSENPTPFMVKDNSMAARAARFSTLLTWIYPLPHYWRSSGAGVAIPDVAQIPALEIVREVVRHLGGPLTEAEMRRWLAEHFPRVSDSLVAVADTRRQQMLAGLDAQWGVATYELRETFAQCRQRLAEVAAVHLDDLSDAERDEGFAEAQVWFDNSPQFKKTAVPGTHTVLGRILLGQAVWRLEAMGAERLSRLRSMFESHLAERVRFTSERLDDLGGRMAAERPAGNATLIPPKLLENPPQMLLSSSRVPAPPRNVSKAAAERSIREAADRAFLGEAVPALDNHTPRAAAQIPGLRPQLVQLMKQRVRLTDEENRETGGTEDINWMLQELGLTELIFAPPPWRPPLARAQDDLPSAMEEMEGSEPPMEIDPNRLPAPPLPPDVFTPDEALERLQAALEQFDTAAAAEMELLRSGSTLLEDANELTLDLFSETDFDFVISFLLQVWFAFVPPGCRAPELDYARMQKAFDSNLRQLRAGAKAATPKKIQTHLLSGAQPALTMTLVNVVLHAAETAPKQIRPTLESQPVIIALLKAVVDELDTVLREDN